MKRGICIAAALLLALILPAAALAVDSIETPTPPPQIEEIIEEYQTIYRLTIYYIYLDGSTAAPTYTEQLDAGTAYSVPSPEIPGYTPTMELVEGVMPARDVEYTVIYIPGADNEEGYSFYYMFWGDPSKGLLTIDDYETPLGFGASFMNVGVCVE